MKHFIVWASMILVLVGAAACTREKPPVVEPTATGVALLSAGTPTATVAVGIVVPTAAVITPTTPTAPTAAATSVLPTTAPTITLPTAFPTTAVVAPTVASTQAPVATGGGTTYTVQWGDWLNKIAGKFGVTTQAILAANPGLNPNYIYPGQVINIPAGGQPGPTPIPGTSVPPPGPPPPNPGTYTVQRGDWFYAIARKFGVSVVALQAANPSVNPNFVYPGQVLNIPGGSTPGGDPSPSTGSTYTVRPGDTLFTIALRFGKTVYSLQIANHLPNPNFIYPGQTLVIP